jgi:endonuclease/exonuclease/phosphatase family metal-dependent hydrolase
MRRLLTLAAAVLLAGCVTPALDGRVDVHDLLSPGTAHAKETFTVLTLNLAHGRGNGFHQALQGQQTARDNLGRIASFLRSVSPDVVALQEADGPSTWSGGFDHVAWLAGKSGYPWASHGAHVRGLGLEYGTALMSRLEKTGRRSHTFPPGLTAPPKGYTHATMRGPRGQLVDVISLHLDPMGRGRREAQLAVIQEHFASRTRPLVVMGDFNAEWDAGSSELAVFADKLELSTWRPDADDLVTFPRMGKRLDWILISDELEFVESQIHDDVLSDHRAVSATLRFRTTGPDRARTFVDMRGLPVSP